MRPVLLAALLAAGCAGPNAETKSAASAKKSLYERLGGKDAIAAVTGELLTRVAADDRINARFANADLPRLKEMLVDQICEATGGPCKYTGKDMKAAHVGQNVTEDEFTALVEDLKAVLDKYKVGATEQNELLAALGGMKGDIVGQ